MKSIELTVLHELGLHARPAVLFVQAAQKYQASVTVSVKDTTVNAKSLLGLLSLGVSRDTVISVAADGVDEDDALIRLSALVNSNFNE